MISRRYTIMFGAAVGILGFFLGWASRPGGSGESFFKERGPTSLAMALQSQSEVQATSVSAEPLNALVREPTIEPEACAREFQTEAELLDSGSALDSVNWQGHVELFLRIGEHVDDTGGDGLETNPQAMSELATVMAELSPAFEELGAETIGEVWRDPRAQARVLACVGLKEGLDKELLDELLDTVESDPQSLTESSEALLSMYSYTSDALVPEMAGPVENAVGAILALSSDEVVIPQDSTSAGVDGHSVQFFCREWARLQEAELDTGAVQSVSRVFQEWSKAGQDVVERLTNEHGPVVRAVLADERGILKETRAGTIELRLNLRLEMARLQDRYEQELYDLLNVGEEARALSFRRSRFVVAPR